jgi:hypothetical protein
MLPGAVSAILIFRGFKKALQPKTSLAPNAAFDRGGMKMENEAAGQIANAGSKKVLKLGGYNFNTGGGGDQTAEDIDKKLKKNGC